MADDVDGSAPGEALASRVRARLSELGRELPTVAAPVAAYVPAVRTGRYVQTSGQLPLVDGADRKSTRLNSSHVAISYAVFCLKKKKTLEDRGRLSPRTTRDGGRQRKDEGDEPKRRGSAPNGCWDGRVVRPRGRGGQPARRGEA